MLKSVIFNNRILHPSAITIAPSVADIFLMIHVINVINIQRTEIQKLHILKRPACAEVI